MKKRAPGGKSPGVMPALPGESMSPHSDPSRCVRWSCDAPCRKLLFIVSEKVRQMAPGVGLGRPSSGPEEATSKWGRSYKWAADLKITWRGGKRRGTVTERAGGEGRGGTMGWHHRESCSKNWSLLETCDHIHHSRGNGSIFPMVVQ